MAGILFGTKGGAGQEGAQKRRATREMPRLETSRGIPRVAAVSEKPLTTPESDKATRRDHARGRTWRRSAAARGRAATGAATAWTAGIESAFESRECDAGATGARSISLSETRAGPRPEKRAREEHAVSRSAARGAEAE